MQTNKILMGGIAGAIAFFFLGWLLYGTLFSNFMDSNTGSATGVHRPETEMVMWAMMLSNLALGFLFAIIISWRASSPSIMQGMRIGAIVGFLMACSLDFVMYGTSNIMNLTGTIGDILIFTVMCALGASVVAWIMGRGTTKAA